MELDLEVKAHVDVTWVVKEGQNGLWVPVQRVKNLQTNYGITAYAQAAGGTYLAPAYMVIETTKATIQSGGGPGTTSFVTDIDPTTAGDVSLVLGVGLQTQETVTFSLKTGSGPFTWTTSASVNQHNTGEFVVRLPLATDTMAQVISEAQYDPVNAPNQRSYTSGNYSPGVGVGTIQFYFSGLAATNLFFAHVGLADQAKIPGVGTNLHNYAALGYFHNNTNDLEIDVTFTLTGG